jgi:hypothetical protein
MRQLEEECACCEEPGCQCGDCMICTEPPIRIRLEPLLER